MKPVFGIVGCGYISTFHLAGLEKAGAKVARVADLDASRAEAAAKRFGATWSTDYRDVIADPSVTVVSVLGPTFTHKAVALAAIAAGKDVVCEKTMTMNRKESLQVMQAAQKAGVMFFTAYMKRQFPAVQKAKELLPALGILHSAYARSYQCWGPGMFEDKVVPQGLIKTHGGVVVRCCGSHILDLVMHLLGRPAGVYANLDYCKNSDVDRKAMAMLEYPGSLTVCFETVCHPLTRIGYEKNSWDESVEISGTLGRIHLCTPTWDKPFNPATLVHYDEKTQTSTEYRFAAVNPFDLEMASFCQQLSKRKQTGPDAMDGFAVDHLIVAMEESHRKKKCVALDWKAF
jgi:predicted dehydrogenase